MITKQPDSFTLFCDNYVKTWQFHVIIFFFCRVAAMCFRIKEFLSPFNPTLGPLSLLLDGSDCYSSNRICVHWETTTPKHLNTKSNILADSPLPSPAAGVQQQRAALRRALVPREAGRRPRRSAGGREAPAGILRGRRQRRHLPGAGERDVRRRLHPLLLVSHTAGDEPSNYTKQPTFCFSVSFTVERSRGCGGVCLLLLLDVKRWVWNIWGRNGDIKWLHFLLQRLLLSL